MVRAAGAVIAILLLVGCDQTSGFSPTSEDDLRVKTRLLEARITALEAKVEERDQAQREATQGVRKLALSTSDSLDSLRKTFNSNVDLDNKKSARDMTLRGACGQETYVDSYNITRLRNKDCTVKDLR